MANFYIDDSGLIYAEQTAVNSTAVGTTDSTNLGLNDAPATSTMSTWLINSIKFNVMGYIDPAGPAVGDGEFSIIAGILQTGITPQPDSLDDFQDLKGWPLKNGWKRVFLENTPQANHFSWTYTYKPRDHLALSRLQEIVLNIKSAKGDWITTSNIYVCASRGR